MQCHSSSSPVGTDALVCPPLIIHSFVLPASNSLFFIVLSYIFWNWRNAFFDLTKRPLRYHGTPSLLSRNALFVITKRFLCCHETPFLLSRNALFVITKYLLYAHGTPSLLSRNALVSPYLEVYLEERNMFIQGMLIMLFLSKDASLKQHVFILFRFRNRFLSLVFLCSSVFPNPLLWLKLQFPLCLFTLLFIYIYTSLFLNVSIYKYKNTFLFIYLCLSSLLF